MNANYLLRRIADTLREMNDAVRRSTELRLSRGLGPAAEPPATYAEFLLRTSAASVHEPSAAHRQRAAGRRPWAAGRDGDCPDRACRC